MNNLYRKLRKNSKALSPVVASIILIAVTVAVSVVVAAWMGGMTIGLMGNAEQVSVTNAIFTGTDEVTLTVRNTGGATVTISTASIDGVADAAFVSGDIAKGTPETFVVTNAADFAPGAQYQITLTTAKGTTIPYTVTYNPVT